MDKDNGFGEFFGSPFAKEYTDSLETAIRRSVSGICMTGDELRRLAEKKGTKRDVGYIDTIMELCCDLIRTSEMSQALVREDLPDESLKVVPMDYFIRDFAESCKKASKGSAVVKVKKSADVEVRTDRDSLRYLLLSFIRRWTVGGEGGKNAFEIVSEKKNETLNITLTALGTFVDGAHMGQPDVFETYYGEICKKLAKRIGASAELSDNALTVEIKLPEAGSGAVIEALSIEFERGFFDPFNIMLSNM